ncbi:TPA: hypothetical protein ACP32N_005107 [Pseudomonas aeruginosa]
MQPSTSLLLRRKAISVALGLALAGASLISKAGVKVLQNTYPDGTAAPAEIYLFGEITSSTTKEVTQALDRAGPKVPMLAFDSAGGDLVAAMELGDTLRRRGVNTSIGKYSGDYGKPLPGICYSACVLAFSGGHFRFADPKAQIGVHRFFRKTSSSADLDVGQVVSAAITSYLIRVGVSPMLFEKMAQVGGGKMQLLSVSEATSLALVNNGILPPNWVIEGKQGAVYLKGEQETWNGTGKLLFSCASPRGVKITALYDAGENNQTILGTARTYTLRLNSQFHPIPKLQSDPKISGEFLMASFVPDSTMLWDLQAAEQIGFGFHPQHAESFYGFLIDARPEREMIRSFINHCQTRN